MAMSAAEFFRIDIVGDASGQRIENSLDYRCVSGTAYPDDEFARDFSDWYDRWIFGSLTGVDHRIRKLTISKYNGFSVVDGKYRAKYSQRFVHDPALGPIEGGSSTLPTFVVCSMQKIGGGGAFTMTAGGAIAAATPDRAIDRGKLPVSPIFEFGTEAGGPNAMSATFRALAKTAGEQLMTFSFRNGTLGGVIEMRMVVLSKYEPKQGPGHTPGFRQVGGQNAVLFRDVTGIRIPLYVGSQNTRKQYERFN